MGKSLPQLYYIKMKISYGLGFIAIRSHHSNVKTPVRFLFIFVCLCDNVPPIIASVMAKFEQILWAFWKYFETKFYESYKKQ